MDTDALLAKYFGKGGLSFDIVRDHSRMVADKALQVARDLNDPSLDLRFIEEAALLHDIGICRTNTPKIGCHGSEPYIRHGIIGREILEAEGLPAHALVCERHIGVGLTATDIASQNLPLPKRDMVPLTPEERIVCFADLFFSKRPGSLTREKSTDEVRKSLLNHGEHKVEILEQWLSEYLPAHV